ncbi:hypothetical protein Q4577_23390 [Marinovum sp. 2_MG-2023]|nr:hypothetical protein [Marinovum sp. 2_MG-2023]MDO6782219.1 hypothetical protein [Marinovum sp. 1_MG-2023]
MYLSPPRYLGDGVGGSQENFEHAHFSSSCIRETTNLIDTSKQPYSLQDKRSAPPDQPPPLMQDFVTPQNGTHPKQSNHMDTTNENIPQATYDRIADTEQHVRRHGAALCNLFDAFDAPSGFDALCD